MKGCCNDYYKITVMNMKYLFPFAIVILVIIFLYSYLGNTSENEKYIEDIQNKRMEIIEFMAYDSESPFHQREAVQFEGLSFFGIDPEFRVKARIQKLTSPEPLKIQMTNGETAEYFRYATAHFTLQGEDQLLTLLKSKDFYDEPWLFLPFYDETSALESYGGGRYLNVEYHDEQQIYIDFNLSYNPYCAYNDNYLCPIPPAGNRITVKVTAGERNYKAHQ